VNAAEAAEADHFATWEVARAEQARLLREVIGNPFQPLPLDRSWIEWNDKAVRVLAREIDLERRYAELPVLADALQEAGCSDEAILSHCRSAETHVRGCWVVDCLLEKE
jgi:hypothetical protein